MKRGGASEAALNGATLEELRDAGHWTNVRTASKYVADTSTSIRKFNRYLNNKSIAIVHPDEQAPPAD